ncbi:MAG: YqaJ viral recombinase family protein [Oscillospiraceae bacterium]
MAKIITSTENLPYEQWLEYRRQGIGGSDAAVVCGISRYKSPFELWLEKTGEQPNREAGEPAYWGTLLEPVVRNEFEKRTGIEVSTTKKLLQSEEHPFMLANLDGICEHPELGTCVFEAKTASAFKAAEWDNTIPDEYMLQIQHYMAVTGYKGAFIAVLIGGNSFKWKFVERDEELISMLIRCEERFWNNVQDGTPPPIDSSEATARFLADKFAECKGETITLPNSAIEIIRRYDTVSAKLDELTEEKRLAENLLKEMLGNNECGTIENSIVTWKSVSQERLDSKKLKTEHPALYKEYATKTTYRRFSIQSFVKEKE